MKRVLVIEDDPAMRDMVEIFLQKSGFHTACAEDGKKALRLFQSESFDLVITDMVMPEMEGIETIQELRKLRPDIKIIAMSGGALGSPAYLGAARHLGANLTLKKPFQHAALIEAVTSLIGVSQ